MEFLGYCLEIVAFCSWNRYWFCANNTGSHRKRFSKRCRRCFLNPCLIQKSGRSFWYRDFPEVKQVVDLRKSRWGESYSIWLGIALKSLVSLEFPKVHECPLQANLEEFVKNKNEIESALNEEDYWKMAADDRKEILKLALCTAECDFFRYLKTQAEVISFVRANKNPHLPINKTLKELAGVSVHGNQ